MVQQQQQQQQQQQHESLCIDLLTWVRHGQPRRQVVVEVQESAQIEREGELEGKARGSKHSSQEQAVKNATAMALQAHGNERK